MNIVARENSSFIVIPLLFISFTGKEAMKASRGNFRISGLIGWEIDGDFNNGENCPWGLLYTSSAHTLTLALTLVGVN